MKKIIDWIKSSNHSRHIALCGVGTMLLMAVGAFIYRPLWHNALEAIATMAVVGVAIEVYQAIASRTFNWRNSLGDLLADVLGIVLGVGLYSLFTLAATQAAIMLMVCSFVSCILAFAMPQHKWKFLGAFLGCLMVGFSLFIYG
ncbi:MAG: hypothetical protein J6U49_00870 [Alistipes sp.]|nr:hypothetical protein [Alistipes sp.]